MNWNALKNCKCPKCGHVLEARYIHKHGNKSTSKHWFCHGNACGFSISNEKFEEIVDSHYKQQRLQPEDERMSEFNNLGHDKVSEDFSDSDALDY